MPDYVVRKLSEALNREKKAVKGSRILVLGLAYKADVDDVRESPAIELIEKLQDLGAHVDYNDPHVPRTHKMREHDLRMTSIPLQPRMLSSYDCVLVATAHSAYDPESIVRHARMVIDTRNLTSRVKRDRHKIVKA
jgi:UDP-N-acetyl-D-glucosamine dehydrogenase